MIDAFLGRLTQPKTQAGGVDPLQLAFAALLVEAARADEHYSEREVAIIDRALAAKFALGDAAVIALRQRAETAQGDAADLQRFTRVAKEMDPADKISLVEELWGLVLSDGERDPFEDTLIRRICGLIYVEDKDSALARSRALDRIAQP